VLPFTYDNLSDRGIGTLERDLGDPVMTRGHKLIYTRIVQWFGRKAFRVTGMRGAVS
jgi:hypothetical protein